MFDGSFRDAYDFNYIELIAKLEQVSFSNILSSVDD